MENGRCFKRPWNLLIHSVDDISRPSTCLVEFPMRRVFCHHSMVGENPSLNQDSPEIHHFWLVKSQFNHHILGYFFHGFPSCRQDE